MNARTSRVDGSSKSIATATATDIVRFKVMRLRRPRVKNAFDFLKLLNECEDTVFDDNNRTMTTTSKDDNRYCAYQALLKQSGVMELREDFGQVKLGERVHLCVLVQNVSSSDDEQKSAVQRREKRIATKVRVMVELLVNAPQAQNQTRQASLVLIDEISSSSSSSSSYSDNVTETMSLKPEETREIEIKFDVKRLGVHCLRCTSEYVDAPHDERSATTIMNVAGENTVYDVGVKRRTTNFFSFNVTNPLHVRTKTRRVIADSLKEKVFLEATIENVDKTDARLISKVALIVDEKRFVSTAIFPDVSDEESLFDLGDREQIYLDHDGGAAHFLFMIEERDDYVIQQRQQTSSSSLTAQALGGELNNNDKDELGTLEICWVGASGEPGRLQTQPILAPKPSDSTPPPPIVNLLERSISTSSSSINKAASQRPILKLTIEIINDIVALKVGDRVSSSIASLLSKMKYTPFTYGLEVLEVYDKGAMYPSSVLDITNASLEAKFMEGVKQVASISLATNYPTLASVPHSIINAYKNVLAISIGTEYTFELAQKVKDYLANPGAFASAAPAAAASGGAAKAAVVEEDDEEEETADFDLFD